MDKIFNSEFYSKLHTLRMSIAMRLAAGMSGGRKSNAKGNSVEFSGVFFCRTIALALFRDNVYHGRLFVFLCSYDGCPDSLDVVAVNGTYIRKSQIFKKLAGNDFKFNSILYLS